MKVEEFPHSVNLSGSDSDLRIQVQTDPRYQSFIASATMQEILGYEMKVASLENVLQGKLWASWMKHDGEARGKRISPIFQE